ncbi:hypothetical protein HELRODRAFT_167650 [Helobdella robusta]|uniref:C2H2-type domain-containing protein n=1 Tax=Helobdella robusta TaxID=6412 RepID=T1EZM3_HELRO|nr:hypothetical protein HELRODRAFT_167650 [Helobdella robusta]ESO09839.1 hypothetical protein HELRODRAFT_167650 [Helobdella robusta]
MARISELEFMMELSVNLSAGLSKKDLNQHLQIIHSTYRCLVCNFTTRSNARLNKHLSENHSSQSEQERMMNTSLSSNNENKKSKRSRKYTCKQCSFSTTIQEDIWMHTRVHVPASKLLSCPRCPFVCAFKHHMQYHLNNHFGFKPYKCELCNYRCNNKSMLNSHLKSHSNEYPFKCQQCSYASKYRQALYIHSIKTNHTLNENVSNVSSKENNKSFHLEKWNKFQKKSVTAFKNKNFNSRDVNRNLENINDFTSLEDVINNYKINTLNFWEMIESNACSKLNLNQTISPLDKYLLRNKIFPNNHPSMQQTSPVKFSNDSLMSYILSSPMPLFQNTTENTSSIRSMPSLLNNFKNEPQSPSSDFRKTPQSTNTPDFVDKKNQTSTSIENPSTLVNNNNKFDNAPNNQTRHLEQSTLQESSCLFPLDLSSSTNRAPSQSEGQNSPDNDLPEHCTKRDDDDKKAKSPMKAKKFKCYYCRITFDDEVLYGFHMDYHTPDDPYKCFLCKETHNGARLFFLHLHQVAHSFKFPKNFI